MEAGELAQGSIHTWEELLERSCLQVAMDQFGLKMAATVVATLCNLSFVVDKAKESKR